MIRSLLCLLFQLQMTCFEGCIDFTMFSILVSEKSLLYQSQGKHGHKQSLWRLVEKHSCETPAISDTALSCSTQYGIILQCESNAPQKSFKLICKDACFRLTHSRERSPFKYNFNQPSNESRFFFNVIDGLWRVFGSLSTFSSWKSLFNLSTQTPPHEFRCSRSPGIRCHYRHQAFFLICQDQWP